VTCACDVSIHNTCNCNPSSLFALLLLLPVQPGYFMAGTECTNCSPPGPNGVVVFVMWLVNLVVTMLAVSISPLLARDKERTTPTNGRVLRMGNCNWVTTLPPLLLALSAYADRQISNLPHAAAAGALIACSTLMYHMTSTSLCHCPRLAGGLPLAT
jgi:hypothetical protein